MVWVLSSSSPLPRESTAIRHETGRKATREVTRKRPLSDTAIETATDTLLWRGMAKKAIPPELRDAAMQRRSKLFAWMVSNHDEFAEVVADAVRPNWQGIAQFLFEREGLTDAEGKAPSGDVARRTWWKARKHVEARLLGKRPARHQKTPLPAKVGKDEAG